MTKMNDYQRFIHLSRYARYLSDQKRRETWEETVTRYVTFFKERFPEYPATTVFNAIYGLEVMPSMRALMTAGPALARDEIAAYNCSYIPVDHQRCFDEIMYVLMCGVGVGFSVERQYINKLPEVPEQMYESGTIIKVADSKIGWASALRELIALLYSGKIPSWDLTSLRPAGAPLKTFGGRASGPEPLDDLFKFAVALYRDAVGRRLNSLEVHDLICKIGEVVVVGGVRRSALISLSNLTDERMRGAKNGQWWVAHGQRALSNNSVAYTEKPDVGIFMREWQTLYESGSGERGIFNRQGAIKRIREGGRRDPAHDFGVNPCGEILLRPFGLCNLSEVIVRPEDDYKSLKEKVHVATIIGTFQAALTNFRYVRAIWKKNAEEERLLGVSLTGFMDHPKLREIDLSCETLLKTLREEAQETNKAWANRIGIAPSVAITTVKPSGTVSQLTNSASGIHPRYSEFYIRRVRMDKKDPLAKFMREEGFPVEDDVVAPDHTDIFQFPERAPTGSVVRSEMSALAQLEHYRAVREWWCDHNASITVYVRPSEWLLVAAWVYDNFEHINGVSFLPYDTGVYRQAPYQEITAEEYARALETMPKNVDWSKLKEDRDSTVASQELACVGNLCEIN